MFWDYIFASGLGNFVKIDGIMNAEKGEEVVGNWETPEISHFIIFSHIDLKADLIHEI